MSSRAKKIFLILSVVVPFVIYGAIYYAPMIRNAPFQEKYFVSLEYSWGTGDKLENSYNSVTGQFKYINKDDALVNSQFKLNTRDIKYLDSIADVQGFWNLPSIVANSEDDLKDPKQLRYVIKFNYQKKSKEVVYLPSFKGSERMKSAAAKMQKEIELTLIDKEK